MEKERLSAWESDAWWLFVAAALRTTSLSVTEVMGPVASALR
jgi:hypothetical protein